MLWGWGFSKLINKKFINYARRKTKLSIFSSENDIPKIGIIRRAKDYSGNKVRKKGLEKYAMKSLISKSMVFLYICGVSFIKFVISFLILNKYLCWDLILIHNGFLK